MNFLRCFSANIRFFLSPVHNGPFPVDCLQARQPAGVVEWGFVERVYAFPTFLRGKRGVCHVASGSRRGRRCLDEHTDARLLRMAIR